MAHNDREGFSFISQQQGGCFDCGKAWNGKNTLAVAARHYDATHHSVWVDTIMSTRYGYRGDGDSAARAHDI